MRAWLVNGDIPASAIYPTTTLESMLKRIAIFLILATAVLAGIYYLRVQVVTSLFNSALKDSDLHLIELQELKVGWRGLAIDQLVLSWDKEMTPQTLEGLRLSYDLLGVQPEHLFIDQANLKMPATSEKEPAAPLLISELVKQLASAPLESLTVSRLMVSGVSMPLVIQPLEIKSSLQSEFLQLDIIDTHQTRLALSLQESAGDTIETELVVTADESPLVSLELRIELEDKRLRLVGYGQLGIEALAKFSSPVMALPEAITSTRGEMAFELSALFDDDLNESGPWQGALSLLPRTRLSLEFAPLIEGASGAMAELELVDGLVVSGVRADSGPPRFSVESEAIALDAKEQRGEISGLLSGLSCNYLHHLSCRGKLNLAARAPELLLEGEQPIKLKKMDLRISSTFLLDDNNLSLQWQPGQLLSLDSLHYGDYLLTRTVLLADSVGDVDYKLTEATFSIRSEQLILMLPQIKMPDLNVATRLTLSDLAASRNGDGSLVAGMGLNADGINLQRATGWLPALALQTNVSLRAGQLLAAGNLHSDQGKLLLSFSTLHKLATGQGTGKFQVDQVTFDPLDNRLSQFFAHWPYDLDIYEGSLLINGMFDWKEGKEGFELRGTLDNRLQGLAGVFGDIGFIGLSGNMTATLESPDTFLTPGDALLTVEQIDVGVPIDAITARFRLDSTHQELNLKAFEASVFDGRIWAENVTYRVDRDYNRIDIGVDGVQLDQLLALAGYDAIEASGSISGLLPLDVGTAGLTMHRGMLAASAPGGVFRYKAEIAPGTNSAMVQALEALSNYHYSIFQAEADYLDSGDLELKMTLRGQNPDMKEARPIHLNMNVSDNIPMLLKSLQSGREIADMVSEKVSKSPQGDGL